MSWPAKPPLGSAAAVLELTSTDLPIQLAASPMRVPERLEAMPERVLFMLEMPATLENCAICATIWVLSTGLNGSCVCIWVVSSLRKSFMPSAEEPAAAVVVVAAGVVLVSERRLSIAEVVIGRASACLE